MRRWDGGREVLTAAALVWLRGRVQTAMIKEALTTMTAWRYTDDSESQESKLVCRRNGRPGVCKLGGLAATASW